METADARNALRKRALQVSKAGGWGTDGKVQADTAGTQLLALRG